MLVALQSKIGRQNLIGRAAGSQEPRDRCNGHSELQMHAFPPFDSSELVHVHSRASYRLNLRPAHMRISKALPSFLLSLCELIEDLTEARQAEFEVLDDLGSEIFRIGQVV